MPDDGVAGDDYVVLAPGCTFGPFRIIELIGRGGMASVYRAYEEDLDRCVALKVLPAELLHDGTFAQRFEREARIVARLEHPNIIPIYRYGIDHGTPWMSMRLLPSGTLTQALRHGTLTRSQIVTILTQVAAALDCAHRQGVTHRDVKPSNCLLDDAGQVYVADFGLAKLTEANVALSRAGAVAGTPRYMAPEQARGDPVDARTDVYALGIMAYELLTGAVPFDADTPIGILYKHATEPPPTPPADRVPESIMRPVLKAVAKNPDDRWDSATAFTNALADAVRSVELSTAADEPTQPLPAFTPARRSPAAHRVRAADSQATVPQGGQVTAAGPAEAAVTGVDPPQGRGRAARVSWAAGAAIVVVVGVMLGMWAWPASGPPGPALPITLTGHTGTVLSAVFSPDGTRVVTASDDGTARVWRADGAGVPVVLTGHTESVRSAAFSPDGTGVVTASRDGTARVWRADGTAAPAVLTGHTGPVVGAAFSPDGTRVVSASADHQARVWRADGTGRPVVLAGHTDSIVSASFSPDGTQVVTASGDGTARVWQVDGTGTPVVLTVGSSVNMAAFSPDGTRVVTAETGFPAARVWPADGTGEPVVLMGHSGSVVAAAFSPDCTLVATASIDGLARVWRADGTGNGNPVVLTGHTDAVRGVAFSPDGTRVVTASPDGTARVWRVDGTEATVVLTGHADEVRSAAFSPDGTRVVTASNDGTARVWSVSAGR